MQVVLKSISCYISSSRSGLRVRAHAIPSMQSSIAVTRSSLSIPESLDRTSGNVSFRDWIGTPGLQRSRVCINSLVALWQEGRGAGCRHIYTFESGVFGPTGSYIYHTKFKSLLVGQMQRNYFSLDKEQSSFSSYSPIWYSEEDLNRIKSWSVILPDVIFAEFRLISKDLESTN